MRHSVVYTWIQDGEFFAIVDVKGVKEHGRQQPISDTLYWFTVRESDRQVKKLLLADAKFVHAADS